MAGNNGRSLENLKSWKPGQSGNPAGRPKRKTIIELVCERIDKDAKQDVMISVIIEMLEKANPFFWREFLERRDGKVKDEVEITQVLPEVHITLPGKNDEDRDRATEGTPDCISEEHF